MVRLIAERGSCCCRCCVLLGIVTSFNNEPVSSVAYNIKKKGAIAKRGDSVIKAAMITLKSLVLWREERKREREKTEFQLWLERKTEKKQLRCLVSVSNVEGSV